MTVTSSVFGYVAGHCLGILLSVHAVVIGDCSLGYFVLNMGLLGDVVVDQVQYIPWCQNPHIAGICETQSLDWSV